MSDPRHVVKTFTDSKSTKIAKYPLQNKGIYKNLPQFDPEVKGLTAIVTGANGISGFHTMRVLLESPNRWKKIWAARYFFFDGSLTEK